jgi:hypothetical protein
MSSLLYNSVQLYPVNHEVPHPSSTLLFKIGRFGDWICLRLEVEPT